MQLNLLSNLNRIETPFVYVTIGEYIFGKYERSNTTGIVKYPNYIQSLTVNKVNGVVNTYVLNMIYAITQYDDPNMIEKAFSSISNSRRIKISYGDYSSPNFIYKEEEAIITDIKSNIDINSSVISYTISCTSSAFSLNAGKLDFKKVVAKPSDIIKKILYNSKYGLLDIFYGMRDQGKVLAQGLIASDDREVTIDARSNISVLDYITYLVKCMSHQSNSNVQLINKSTYELNIVDDITGLWGGPYFTVKRINTNSVDDKAIDMYNIDIGTFSKDVVLSFNIENSEMYSILYNYSNKIQQSNYIYRINNDGELESLYSPTLALNNSLMKTTEADKNWWTQVTQYPISATITLKGLLRPAILMSYVKLNVLFYGRKHISSGTYIITKQTDSIDSSGYRTQLRLTRIKGEDNIDY